MERASVNCLVIGHKIRARWLVSTLNTEGGFKATEFMYACIGGRS